MESRNDEVKRDWGLLRAGWRYRVIEAFMDFDRRVHPVGETWVYRRYAFLPYDDGLSLFVETDEGQMWHIRMQLRAEEQEAIVGEFGRYLREEQEG